MRVMQFTGIASFACCSASALCLAAQLVKSDAVHSITASFSLTAKHCLLQQAIVSRAVLLPKLKQRMKKGHLHLGQYFKAYHLGLQVAAHLGVQFGIFAAAASPKVA